MNRWVRLGLIGVAALLGLILASGIVIRSLVSGSLKDWFTASLEARTGSKVAIGRADFNLLRWFIFRPAVTLHDVSIANPPGFPAANLLETKKVSARLALFPLFRRRVEVESITIDQPSIMIEPDAQGHTNLEVFLKTVAARRRESLNKSTAGGSGVPPAPPLKKEALLAINDLKANAGTLTYSGSKAADLSELSVHLRGLCQDEPCRLEASANLFGGKVSMLKIEGRIGPFAPDSLPLDGTLKVTLALAELPADLRAEKFGAILASPGDKARATVESSIKGDVYQSLSGPAKLALTDVMIGGHPEHLMPLSGNAPGSITAINLMTRPEFKLEIPDADLQVGKGQWKGAANFRLLGKTISGDSHGAIHNVEINQFLSTFTSARGKIFGLLAMPSSALQFRGANGAEISASLQGSAKLSVADGRLSMLDFPATLRKVLGAGSDSTEGTPGITTFSTVRADLTIAQKKINVANMLLEGQAIRLTGSGVIQFDHTLDFDVLAHVTDKLLSQIGKIGPFHLPSMAADVPLSITGTLEHPKVRPKLGKIAKGAVKSAAVDTVLKVMKRKLR